MKTQTSNLHIVSKLMIRLMFAQVLLTVVGEANGIISSYFASNYVSVSALGAVGLYSPINMLFTTFNVLLSGGVAILCGKYLGRNDQEKVQNVFSLNLMLALVIGAVFTALFLVMGLFDLTGFFTRDAAIRPIFNRYLVGQVWGIIPLILGTQLPAFLIMENKQKLVTIASVIFAGVNVVLNLLFLRVLHLQELGIALASSLGLWVFFGVQASAFFSKKSSLHFELRPIDWREGFEVFRVGYSGATGKAYGAIRRIALNRLVEYFVGSVGVSAFAGTTNLLSLVWAIPNGMLVVSRLMISIAVGEEDRQSLTDVMRVMFRRYMPIVAAVDLIVILCAKPLASILFKDPLDPVYMMTVWGLRIVPLAMCPNLMATHFMCYGQASGKDGLVNLLSFLNGVGCMVAFTALMIPWVGMNSAFISSVLNSTVCAIVVIIYAWMKNRHYPATMEELMVIPKDFGVGPEARIDISVKNMEEVLTVSKRVTDFCRSHGVDERRVYLASLCMEEMAGNIVEHGFTKDHKNHSIDIRVVYKEGTVLLRIRDDCVPFNPQERKELSISKDNLKNAGIRIVYQIAESVDYQYLLGLNVLTIKI
ncbi:MAG: ATP-binding protein [Blautia sp.]|nr:ATP-binding protein [Blautia sp.]